MFKVGKVFSILFAVLFGATFLYIFYSGIFGAPCVEEKGLWADSHCSYQGLKFFIGGLASFILAAFSLCGFVAIMAAEEDEKRSQSNSQSLKAPV